MSVSEDDSISSIVRHFAPDLSKQYFEHFEHRLVDSVRFLSGFCLETPDVWINILRDLDDQQIPDVSRVIDTLMVAYVVRSCQTKPDYGTRSDPPECYEAAKAALSLAIEDDRCPAYAREICRVLV